MNSIDFYSTSTDLNKHKGAVDGWLGVMQIRNIAHAGSDRKNDDADADRDSKDK